MDGNRRWALINNKTKMEGHTAGAKNIKRIAEECINKGISHLTIWGLSTENLKEREANEIKHIFSLAKKILEHFDWLKKNKIRVKVIGTRENLPKFLNKIMDKVMNETKGNQNLNLILAFNYGGKDEITRAIKSIVDSKISSKDVNEELISKYLDTNEIPDPNLIIRTGGSIRLSGFLPWQSVYSELYFTKTFWPDFDEKELDKAIEYYNGAKRNFGR